MRFDRPTPSTMVITLTDSEVTRLQRTAARNGFGRGGFQNHLWRLSQRVQGNTIVLTDPILIERTVRYTSRYGDGGFQNRIGGRARFGSKEV